MNIPLKVLPNSEYLQNQEPNKSEANRLEKSFVNAKKVLFTYSVWWFFKWAKIILTECIWYI